MEFNNIRECKIFSLLWRMLDELNEIEDNLNGLIICVKKQKVSTCKARKVASEWIARYKTVLVRLNKIFYTNKKYFSDENIYKFRKKRNSIMNLFRSDFNFFNV